MCVCGAALKCRSEKHPPSCGRRRGVAAAAAAAADCGSALMGCDVDTVGSVGDCAIDHHSWTADVLIMHYINKVANGTEEK